MTTNNQLERVRLFKQKQYEQGIIENSIRTSFIGALSCFEKYFGKLWGIGKPIEECHEEQKILRELWEDCRKAVLDLGNNQIRNLK